MRCILYFIGAIFMLVGSLMFGFGVIATILIFLSSVSGIPSETMGLIVWLIVIGVALFFWGSVFIIVGRLLTPKVAESSLDYGHPTKKHRADIWEEDTWDREEYEKRRDEELDELQAIYDAKEEDRKEEKREKKKQREKEEEEYDDDDYYEDDDDYDDYVEDYEDGY